MSTPEVDGADLQEQRTSPSGDAPVRPAPDVPLEAPDADVVEQAVATGPGEHVAESGGDAGVLPLEADPADAYEQAVVVELDEDDRR